MTRLRHLFLGGGIGPPLWWKPWLARWQRKSRER